MRRLLPMLLLAVLAGLAGCSTYDRQIDQGANLGGLKHCFIVTNSNDNHGLDRQIAAALKLRGIESDSGPLTMLPDDAQAIVTYEDHWTWDFGDRLVYLQVSLRDAHSQKPLGSARFSAKVPGRKAVAVVIGELADRLFGGS